MAVTFGGVTAVGEELEFNDAEDAEERELEELRRYEQRRASLRAVQREAERVLILFDAASEVVSRQLEKSLRTCSCAVCQRPFSQPAEMEETASIFTTSL